MPLFSLWLDAVLHGVLRWASGTGQACQADNFWHLSHRTLCSLSGWASEVCMCMYVQHLGTKG